MVSLLQAFCAITEQCFHVFEPNYAGLVYYHDNGSIKTATANVQIATSSLGTAMSTWIYSAQNHPPSHNQKENKPSIQSIEVFDCINTKLNIKDTVTQILNTKG